MMVMDYTNDDFFSFLGLVFKVLVTIIGLRLLLIFFGIHIEVPIIDPMIGVIRNFLASLGFSPIKPGW